MCPIPIILPREKGWRSCRKLINFPNALENVNEFIKLLCKPTMCFCLQTEKHLMGLTFLLLLTVILTARLIMRGIALDH